jgi:membrane-associated protein
MGGKRHVQWLPGWPGRSSPTRLGRGHALAGLVARRLDAIPPASLYAVVAVLLVLETTVLIGLVTPGEVVLLAAATRSATCPSTSRWAAVGGGASVLGHTTGGYLIGRRFGGRIRGSWAGRRIGEPHWARAEGVLRGGAGRAIVGSRFLAVAHSLVPGDRGDAADAPAAVRALHRARGGGVGTGLRRLGSAASTAVRHSAHLIGPVFTGVLVGAVVIVLVVRAVRARRRERALRAVAVEPAPLG